MNSLLPRSLRFLVFLLPALVVSASCDDVSAAERRYAEYLDAYAEARCGCLFEYGLGCATGGSVWRPAVRVRVLETNLYPSRSDCVRTVRAGAHASLTPTLRDALAAGTTRFDSEAAAVCLATIRGRGPSDYADGSSAWNACTRVLVGQQPDGAACRTSEECSSRSTCDADASGCRVCIRRFPDPAQLGEPCGFGGRSCASGLVCTPTGPGPFDSTCVAAIAPTVVAEGGPCGPTAEGGFAACAWGLFCRREPQQSIGTCTAKIAVGAPCSRDALDVCVVGSDCATPGVSEPGVCTRVTVSKHAGDACDPSPWSVRTCSLAANLDCDATTSRCVAPAPGNENARCDGDWDCTPPHHCEAGRCLPPRPEGWRCRSDVTCASAVCEIAPGELEGACGPSRAVPFCQ